MFYVMLKLIYMYIKLRDAWKIKNVKIKSTKTY